MEDALQDELVAQGLIDEVQVLETSRIGGCSNGPELMVYPEGIHYVGLTADDMPYLVEEHFLKGRPVKKFMEQVTVVTDEELGPPKPKEVRVVLRNCGQIDPNNIEDYIAEDGYQALAKVLGEMTPRASDRRSAAIGFARARRRGFPGRQEVAALPQRATTRPSTSPATPTKATPARS